MRSRNSSSKSTQKAEAANFSTYIPESVPYCNFKSCRYWHDPGDVCPILEESLSDLIPINVRSFAWTRLRVPAVLRTWNNVDTTGTQKPIQALLVELGLCLLRAGPWLTNKRMGASIYTGRCTWLRHPTVPPPVSSKKGFVTKGDWPLGFLTIMTVARKKYFIFNNSGSIFCFGFLKSS